MGRYFYCSKTGPIVETKAGKIRGFQVDSTYTFHGIKYADAKRFQAPQPVKPWKGVKDALAYGYVSPLMEQDKPTMEVLIPHRYWLEDENCQYLNIWTQSLDRQAKKPVMVWFHGGGFFAGSSIEHVAYEGDHLSEFGDVVVVSVNHRLNVLGYLDLSPFGEKYKNSGNAGNADLVAALKWIQENIEGFGGDPANVTIFGQSGGGMKVYSLMNTPEADGLFAKGIIQSGVLGKYKGKAIRDDKGENGRELVTAMLEELGLGVEEVEKLETIPYAALRDAYRKVAPAIAEKGGYTGNRPLANDWYVGDPRTVGFTEHAKTIPVLIGSVFGEFDFGPVPEGKQEMSREEAVELLKRRFGEDAEAVAAEFEKVYPGKKLAAALSLDTLFRVPSADFARLKSMHKESGTWSYLFTYEFPFDGGKEAWHCSEIPFVFHNIDRVPVCNEPGVTDRLQEKLASIWVNFARYGSPQIASLPAWPACKDGIEHTMLLDVECKLVTNHDDQLQKLMADHMPLPPLVKNEDGEEEQVMLH